MLEEMWAAIASVLETRWADPLCRKSWVKAAIRQGQILLGDRVWHIEYGTGWSPDALNELNKLVPRERSCCATGDPSRRQNQDRRRLS